MSRYDDRDRYGGSRGGREKRYVEDSGRRDREEDRRGGRDGYERGGSRRDRERDYERGGRGDEPAHRRLDRRRSRSRDRDRERSPGDRRAGGRDREGGRDGSRERRRSSRSRSPRRDVKRRRSEEPPPRLPDDGELPPLPPMDGEGVEGLQLSGGGGEEEMGDAEGGPKAIELDAELTPEELMLMQQMGIPFGFETTHGKHVDDDGANAGAVKIKSTRQGRQFMNRRGGFNRALPEEKTGQKVGIQWLKS